ncbi:MAG: D-aminoacyl-tRNA deacylase [Bryobacteraceae bacterium]|jgi:D-tyrosyl-tRNA(Tyr) deacylase
MRIVVQRVSEASVEVAGETVGSIGGGLLLLLGITHADTTAQADFLAAKIAGLRIFPDEEGKMNRSVKDAAGSILVVSQFTLYGDTRKGRRPSFDAAAPPEQARTLYEYFVECLRAAGFEVRTGVFQATMQVKLINDGPVTFIVEA